MTSTDAFEKLSEHYQTLLDSGHLSDVALVVGEKEIRAHKLILFTRSLVFADMFAHSTKNPVEITNMDVEVFELMVRYIYTGKVYHLVQYDAIDLFLTADKYHLDGLKSICEHHLYWQITIESVCDLLHFADKYQVTELYSKCLLYIVNESMDEHSGTELLATDGWKRIVERADLLVMLFEYLYGNYAYECARLLDAIEGDFMNHHDDMISEFHERINLF